jgi:glycosyltransferase involved in cell wall biosynthesis
MNTTVFKLDDVGEKHNVEIDSNTDLSVVIPVYNSEGIILELHKRLTNELSSLVRDYELIFVNDDSPDNIWAKIQTLAATDPHVKAISLRRNFGYDSALMAGLNYVRYPYVVIMDDDLQHAPEEIPLLLTEIEKGFDVVYGNFLVKKQSLVKNLGSWFVGKLAQLIVNKPTAKIFDKRLLFNQEISINHIESFFNFGKKKGNLFRGMLKVVIHNHHVGISYII